MPRAGRRRAEYAWLAADPLAFPLPIACPGLRIKLYLHIGICGKMNGFWGLSSPLKVKDFNTWIKIPVVNLPKLLLLAI